MSRRPRMLMSFAYLLVLCTGFGTGGLWPVYLNRLGAGPMEVGIMNAVSGPASLVGALLCGWLSDRFRRRRETFIFACCLFTLTWGLMSRATTWQQLTALNLLAGLSMGMSTNMIVIMTGLLSDAASRGQSFGVLTFVSSASLLVSGLVWGPIADHWGFPTLLVLDAIICAACVIPGMFFTEPPLVRAAAAGPRSGEGGGLGLSYYLLLAAALTAMVASYGGGFGRSVAMSQLGFSASAVGLATAIGGGISLPAPLVLGWLSDRIGRKRLLILCYVAGLVALPIMGFTVTVWGFWGASVLLGVMATCQSLQQALATDMLPHHLVGRGLAVLGSMSALSILGSSLVIGAAFQGLGTRNTFFLWTIAPLLAIALLSQVRERGRTAETGHGVGVAA